MQEPGNYPHTYHPETKLNEPHAQPYPYVLNIILGTSCALLMFQLYLIAPLMPSYAKEFNSSLMGMSIPAFAIPFAIAAAGMALFSSAIRKPDKWFTFSLLAMSMGSLLLSTVRSSEGFLLNRVLTGLGTGTLLPAALIIATRSVDIKQSFTNLTVIIFFLATGMTFAPSVGGWLNGSVGWRFLYQVIGITAALFWLAYIMLIRRSHQTLYRQQHLVKTASVLQIIWKSRAIYAFVFLSGVFHSAVFVWIIYYFSTQYSLDEYHIANPLIIFGFPGLTITMLMFRYHLDSRVTRILYSGLFITIAGLFVMLADLPLWLAECLLAVMSVGYCFSQPLFIGILKLPLAGLAAGRLIALGSGILFAGYGTGPLIMGVLLGYDKIVSISFLVLLVMVMTLLSRAVWRISELHSRHNLLNENHPKRLKINLL